MSPNVSRYFFFRKGTIFFLLFLMNFIILFQIIFILFSNCWIQFLSCLALSISVYISDQLDRECRYTIWSRVSSERVSFLLIPLWASCTLWHGVKFWVAVDSVLGSGAADNKQERKLLVLEKLNSLSHPPL